MKIFLSWSGEQSHMLASALAVWLKDVFQSVDVFLSTQDIEAGEVWFERLNEVLKDQEFGIVCATKKTLKSPYVMFESGAIAKGVTKARLIPVLINMDEHDLIKHPFQHFNYVHLTEKGIKKLVDTINLNLDEKQRLSSDALKKAFGKWWSDLSRQIDKIVATPDEPRKKTLDTNAAIEEILAILRDLSRRRTAPVLPPLPLAPGVGLLPTAGDTGDLGNFLLNKVSVVRCFATG